MASGCSLLLQSSLFVATVSAFFPNVGLPTLEAKGHPRHCSGGNKCHSTTNPDKTNKWRDTIDVDLSEHPSVEGGSGYMSPFKLDVDVQVDKVPMFAFFANGGGQREAFVGRSNVAACRKQLEEKLLYFSENSERLGLSEKPQGISDYEKMLESDNERQTMQDFQAEADDGNNHRYQTGNHDVDDNGIINIRSKDELVHIICSRRPEQGPVVVMYHAPWCRKCRYLARAFRLVAQQHAAELDVGMRTESASFCRVDVSNLSDRPWWGRGAGLGKMVANTEETITTGMDSISTSMRGTQEASQIDLSLHEGSAAMEHCEVCGGSGFISCGECEGKGRITRSSPDGKHHVAVPCPTCVGYKKLRCETCGGKCFMCD